WYLPCIILRGAAGVIITGPDASVRPRWTMAVGLAVFLEQLLLSTVPRRGRFHAPFDGWPQNKFAYFSCLWRVYLRALANLKFTGSDGDGLGEDEDAVDAAFVRALTTSEYSVEEASGLDAAVLLSDGSFVYADNEGSGADTYYLVSQGDDGNWTRKELKADYG